MLSVRSIRYCDWCSLAICVLLASHRAIAEPPTFLIQPVAPQTIPPSSYPPGTTIVGQEIILGSVPARVWFEVYVTNWSPLQPKALQAVLAATDRDFDGGGFSGSMAVCDGVPTNGEDLGPAFVSCATDTDCRAPLSGPPCELAEAAQCNFHNFGYWPVGNWCDVAFQNQCHSRWIGSGVEHIAVVDESTMDFRFAIALYPGEVMPDHEPSYLGTFVLDIPAGAKGSYQLDFVESETFLVTEDPLCGNAGCPPVIWQGATVTVPCGRCCTGVGSPMAECVEGISAEECEALDAFAVFEPNSHCLDNGGAACPQCITDGHCDDGAYCNGRELCNVTGGCEPGEPPCAASQCDEAQDECPSGIPTVSNWGLVILVLALLVTAKLRYRQCWIGRNP